MKAFHCDQCGNVLFFENTRCVKCDATLGFLPDVLDLSALEPAGDGAWRGHSPAAKDRVYRSCRNQTEFQVCNWLVPAADKTELCPSCRLNEIVPDLSLPPNQAHWHKLESAKRRLLYTLMHLGLPISVKSEPPLRFRFLADPPNGPQVITGHSQGVITMNIAEADDVYREQQRVNFHEPFRTLLGHFRHESAHYYWDQLIAATPQLEAFRRLFGDERQDYAAGLNTYYKSGPPADWQLRHVSAYASAHPWEDWAETWAHYLHIQDTVETAASFGLRLKPSHSDAAALCADPQRVAEAERRFDRILREWLPVTSALNELNRGMGLPDVYPFVLTEAAIAKLRFVHEVVLSARIASANGGP
jgi:hypothetical protein